jgi:hypothetical protein
MNCFIGIENQDNTIDGVFCDEHFAGIEMRPVDHLDHSLYLEYTKDVLNHCFNKETIQTLFEKKEPVKFDNFNLIKGIKDYVFLYSSGHWMLSISGGIFTPL